MDEVAALRRERNRLRAALGKCLDLMNTKAWGSEGVVYPAPELVKWWPRYPAAQAAFDEAEALLKLP